MQLRGAYQHLKNERKANKKTWCTLAATVQINKTSKELKQKIVQTNEKQNKNKNEKAKTKKRNKNKKKNKQKTMTKNGNVKQTKN